MAHRDYDQASKIYVGGLRDDANKHDIEAWRIYWQKNAEERVILFINHPTFFAKYSAPVSGRFLQVRPREERLGGEKAPGLRLRGDGGPQGRGWRRPGPGWDQDLREQVTTNKMAEAKAYLWSFRIKWDCRYMLYLKYSFTFTVLVCTFSWDIWVLLGILFEDLIFVWKLTGYL